MRKKLCLFLLIVTIVFNTFTVFAADSKMIYKDIRYLTANIYVCDTQNIRAILLNVKPMGLGRPNSLMVSEMEFRSTPINASAIYGSKGQKLSMETVNGYLLDSKVKVLVGKNGYGYKVLRMDFLN